MTVDRPHRREARRQHAPGGSPASSGIDDADLPDEILELARLLAEIAAAEQTEAGAADRDGAAADR